MRALSGSFLVVVLASMLVLTTPVGTGEGVHQDNLLHPVFPHLHFVDGRSVAHDASPVSQPTVSRRPGGLAIGAGSGPEAAGLGLALVPTVPMHEFSLPRWVVGRLTVSDPTLRRLFLDAPPDPPPDLMA